MDTTDQDTIEVIQKANPRRFEAHMGEETVGYIEYDDAEGVRDLTHTFVQPKYRGKGIAARLVAEALDTTRQQNLLVRPSCPYIRSFIEGHDGYRDLLEAPRGKDFNVPG